MQTRLPEPFSTTAAGQAADEILRRCVHCGFCTATCPTYQQLGDERDSPRGRIYLIKSWLEGDSDGRVAQQHLDRCLSCRSCETTCPSGVEYGRLADIARQRMEQQLPRPWPQRLLRQALLQVLPFRGRFALVLRLGQWLRPVLPGSLRRQIPARQLPQTVVAGQHPRRMVLLQGCVQPLLQPSIDAAATRLLDALGIRLESQPDSGCCGAIEQHLGREDRALRRIRRAVDLWYPLIEDGIEAIIATSSGCAAQLKEYGWLLREDEAYARRARAVSEKVKDICEVLRPEDLARLRRKPSAPRSLSFQSPCSLQHGLQLAGRVEQVLQAAGFELLPVDEGHLCCGSAGTYSILQPQLSAQLRERKLNNLQAPLPAMIATANIGCLKHLQVGANVPVRHWLELLEVIPQPTENAGMANGVRP